MYSILIAVLYYLIFENIDERCDYQYVDIDS